jgi:hypothetical protein
MAAASYTTDLTDFETFENGASTVTEVTGYTASRQFEDQDGDNPIQGSVHASAEQRTANTGSIVSSGTGTTLAAGEAFFIWQNFLQAGAVNTFANDGIVGIVGTGTGAYYRWTVGGNDFGRNPYGGWANLVCDPTITTGRSQQGTPGTSYSIVGFGCDVINAISKGSPYNLDAIRYGRGELIVTDGDLANGYATFEGMAAQNDTQTNRWGLFQEQFGSYLWKGLLNLGNTTSVDFRDSNKAIFIDNTPVVSSSFNRIEVRGTASNIDWDAVNITALGITGPTNGTTSSRGEFEMIDGATLDFNTCVFTDMATFIFQKGTGACTLTNSTFRRCYNVTTNGATFDTCTFDKQTDATSLNPVAVTLTNASGLTDASELSKLAGCTFNSPGRGYGIDLGTISSNVAVSVNLDNVTFTDYSPGAIGDNTGEIAPGSPNIAILVDYRGTADLTINVINGSTTPSLLNTGSGTVTVAAPPRNFALTGLKDRTEVRLINSTNNTEIAGVENVIGGVGTGTTSGVTVTGSTDLNNFNYAYQYSADTDIFAAIISSSTYEIIYLEESLLDSDKSIPIQQQIDRNSNL